MFPAHAGMNRPVRKYQSETFTELVLDFGGAGLMFPAHAGMNRGTKTRIYHYVHVPRTRGDEPESSSGSVTRR